MSVGEHLRSKEQRYSRATNLAPAGEYSAYNVTLVPVTGNVTSGKYLSTIRKSLVFHKFCFKSVKLVKEKVRKPGGTLFVR